ERENRSMACRAFPFYPYITRENEFVGLAYYWDFEDSCWVISNLAVVDADFVREFVRAHEMLFEVDRDEFDTFRQQAADMRRVFSRRNRYIPLIGRDGGPRAPPNKRSARGGPALSPPIPPSSASTAPTSPRRPMPAPSRRRRPRKNAPSSSRPTRRSDLTIRKANHRGTETQRKSQSR